MDAHRISQAWKLLGSECDTIRATVWGQLKEARDKTRPGTEERSPLPQPNLRWQGGGGGGEGGHGDIRTAWCDAYMPPGPVVEGGSPLLPALSHPNSPSSRSHDATSTVSMREWSRLAQSIQFF